MSEHAVYYPKEESKDTVSDPKEESKDTVSDPKEKIISVIEKHFPPLEEIEEVIPEPKPYIVNTVTGRPDMRKKENKDIKAYNETIKDKKPIKEKNAFEKYLRNIAKKLKVKEETKKLLNKRLYNKTPEGIERTKLTALKEIQNSALNEIEKLIGEYKGIYATLGSSYNEDNINKILETLYEKFEKKIMSHVESDNIEKNLIELENTLKKYVTDIKFLSYKRDLKLEDKIEDYKGPKSSPYYKGILKEALIDTIDYALEIFDKTNPYKSVYLSKINALVVQLNDLIIKGPKYKINEDYNLVEENTGKYMLHKEKEKEEEEEEEEEEEKLKQKEEGLLLDYNNYIRTTDVQVSKTLSNPLQYFIDQYDKSIKSTKIKSNTKATYKTNVAKAYKNIINKGVELLNTDVRLDNFVLHDKIDEYIADYNKLYVRDEKHVLNLNVDTNTYVFEKGTISNDPKFKTYLQVSVADQIVDDYWALQNPDNPEVRKPTILTVYDKYGDVVNDIINKINNSKINIFDDPFDKESSTFGPYKKFSESFSKKDNNYINKKNSYAYMDTIVNVNGNKIYNTEEEKEKAYTKPGKFFEYDQSGDNNINKSNVLFGKRGAVVEVTDQIVNNVFTSKTNNPSNIGLQFCIDNVSRCGKFFSEAKYYTSINYTRWYNLNIELKKAYYDELTIEVEVLIKKIMIETDIIRKKSLLDNLEIYTDTLTNKDLFNLDFYQNKPYMGIGISMNKFSPIVYSDGFLDNLSEKLNRSEYERAITLQKQKFAPLIVDKKITKIIYKEGSREIQEYFNTNFNRQIGVSEKTPFDYYFTIAFNNVIGVWNFSTDINIKNNNPLEWYRLGYSFDTQKNKGKKAVVLPIEVIIPKA